MNNRLRDQLRHLEKVVGNTPVQRIESKRFELFCKLEFLNFTGSVKDRPAFYVIKKGVESGIIGPNSTIIESSSGNFASALAAIARNLNIQFIPVIDPNIVKSYENFLYLCCDSVAKVTERDDQGGFQRTRIGKVSDLIQQIPHSFWPDQYGNPLCMEAHYYTTGAEICEQVAPLDFAFIGVSSGGSIAGISNRLKEHFPKIKIIAVDALGSVIFNDQSRRRYIPGIGSTSRPALVDKAIIDEVVWVSEPETVKACHRLLRHHGIFGGGSTGTVYAAIEDYFKDYRGSGRKPRVLMLSPDRGHAYLDTVYNHQWCSWLMAQHGVAPPRRSCIMDNAVVTHGPWDHQ
jgi:cysteine synthase A